MTQLGSSLLSSKRVDLSYNAASQLQRLNRYRGIGSSDLVAFSDYQYNTTGRLIELGHYDEDEVLAKYNFDYDKVSRITRLTSLVDGVTDYTYDAIDQLTGSNSSSVRDESFTYDANGNRVYGDYVVGANNRLLSDGIHDYTYDGEGNLITQIEIATGVKESFSWDYRNRLVGVITTGSNGVVIESVEYVYDVFDRRITKSVDSDGDGINPAVVEEYVYDDDNLALVFDEAGNRTERFFYGTGIDEVLAKEDEDGEVVWSLNDYQGSVKDVVDGNGNVLNHINYDAFGGVATETNPSVEFRFGYTGRELDSETGNYYYRSRYYDPTVGRFISEDTIGFDGGDANLYRYVGNSSPNYTDPFGLETRIYVHHGNTPYGHVSIDVNGTVYTFGRYGDQPNAESAGSKGDGVLYKVPREQYIKPEYDENGARLDGYTGNRDVIERWSIDYTPEQEAQIVKFFEDLYNNAKDRGKKSQHTGLIGRRVKEYDLDSSNCATTTID